MKPENLKLEIIKQYRTQKNYISKKTMAGFLVRYVNLILSGFTEN